MCTQNNAFLAIFKRAKVTALLKTEAILSDLNDYCPISILPVLTKTLEKHIHKHLTDFLEIHDLLHSSQSGFRRGHSTDTWLSAFNKRQISVAVFLDLRNTFDLVNHDILLKKLSAYNLSTEAFTFLQSCLHGRPQCVLVNGTYSNKTSITYGVPQGSILTPVISPISGRLVEGGSVFLPVWVQRTCPLP